MSARKTYTFNIYLNHGLPNAPQVKVRACDFNNPVFLSVTGKKSRTPEELAQDTAIVKQLAEEARLHDLAELAT